MKTLYKCDKCDQLYNDFAHLQRHLNSKRGCFKNNVKGSIFEKFQCKACNSYFNTQGNLQRHMLNPKLGCFHILSQNRNIEEKFNKIQEKIEQIALSKNSSQNQLTIPPTVINNNQIQLGSIGSIGPIGEMASLCESTEEKLGPKKIKFAKHGKERVDHITKGTVMQLFLNRFSFACEELMKLVYFNEDIPENCSWTIAYPKNDNAGIEYNHEKDTFERKATSDIIERKFSNMIELLMPVVESIYEDEALYNSLNHVQKGNIARFKSHYGLYQISTESPYIYQVLHKMCYEQRHVPMATWRENGYKGNHLSLKF